MEKTTNIQSNSQSEKLKTYEKDNGPLTHEQISKIKNINRELSSKYIVFDDKLF